MKIVLLSILLIYIFICVVFYFFQHLFFFRPEILPQHFNYKYPFPFEELDFEMADGGKINAIYFKVPNSRGVVFYLKGNSKSIKGWGKFAKDFLSNGYDFFMMDYRGFGKSKGRRNQAVLFNDSQKMYDWLKNKYAENTIVLYGRSLGSGIAAYIASKNQPRLLILDSPYLSFYHNIHRFLFFTPLKWLLRYDIRTDEYLSKVSSPIHIIHGDKDRLIPFIQSMSLKKLYPDKINLYKIKGAGHNNLPDFSEFFDLVYEILYIKPNADGNKNTKNI